MTAEEYFEEEVENENLELLELLLEDDTSIRIRLNEATPVENYARDIFDTLIEEAPPLSEALTIYKEYSYPALRNGGDMIENTFFNGSTSPGALSPGSGNAAIALTLPAGTKVLKLGDVGYLLPRGAKLSLQPTASGVIPATLTGFSNTVFKSPGLASKPVSPEPETLATENVEEFFNPFHARDGRFAKGNGGGAKAAAGRKLLNNRYPASKATEALAAADRKERLKVIGKKILKAAIITAVVIGTLMVAKKGLDTAITHQADKISPNAAIHSHDPGGGRPKLSLIDNTGKVSAGRAKKMLEDLDEANKASPLATGKTPRIMVKERSPFNPLGSAVAFVFMGGKSNTIHVNRASLDDTGNEKAALEAMGAEGKRFFMPGFKRDRTKQIVTHEYGHLHDFHKQRSLGPIRGKIYARKRKRVFEQTKDDPTLSTYGKKNQYEAYAETFAEHHTSRGETTSTAAATYREQFGW